MIKTTREDYLDLNTDGSLDLDKVNQFMKKLQEEYETDEKEETEDGDKGNEI